ncbi:hypothetical protein ACFWHL_21200, partial [Streptomyces massasporeus]
AANRRERPSGGGPAATADGAIRQRWPDGSSPVAASDSDGLVAQGRRRAGRALRQQSSDGGRPSAVLGWG